MSRPTIASFSLRVLLPLCLATLGGCAAVNPNTSSDLSLFSKNVEWDDDVFEVRSERDKLTIRTFGQDEGNEVFEHSIEGTVTGAEAADLNHDGFPELLVYVTSDGSGSYGTVIGYSSNNGKSMSQIFFPATADNPQINQGYMGHDTFSTAEDSLVQSFPVYRPGDANSHPTGPTRQVQYALVDGEASRKFQVSRSFEN
ncbi:MAG: hypothetical protein RL518_2597 [Pseudomonadota bacterium]|jgi:hypothetical protein